MGWQSTFTSPSIVFIDASVWFAAALKRDVHNERAKAILEQISTPITTDHVLLETWMLLRSRYNHDAAERFWDGIRACGVQVETVTPADLAGAWAAGQAFSDHELSLVDRTSFAVMERLRIATAARLWRRLRCLPVRPFAPEEPRSAAVAAGA
jgi:uncharacterized protein